MKDKSLWLDTPNYEELIVFLAYGIKEKPTQGQFSKNGWFMVKDELDTKDSLIKEDKKIEYIFIHDVSSRRICSWKLITQILKKCYPTCCAKTRVALQR